jgi:uncharacterized protein (TIGR03067 family)
MRLILTCAAACWAVAAFAQNPGAPRPADTGKADPAKANALDGTWTVVSIEKNGEPMKDAKDMTVTVKDNTVTCSGKDGKPAMTVRFEFAGPGQARVTMDEGANAERRTGTGTGTADKPADDTKKPADGGKPGTKAAVYVLTSDHLAVCIHDDKAPATGDRTGAITTQPSAKSYCSIILKRAERK